ncbi:MAG: alpha/beta fold hydrolase [Myxococcota bacterium]
MPTAQVNGVELFYEDEGEGFPVIFGHSLVWDHEMFVHQVKALSKNYRCINVDYRNHGKSGTVCKEWTLYDYVDDNIALAEHLGIASAHWVGLSQGGMMAMRLALKRPELVRSLVILDSSAAPEDAEKRPQYEMMANMAAEQGSETVVEGVLPIFFAEDFKRDYPDQLAYYREKFIKSDADAMKWAVFAVTGRDDVSDKISAITAPALVIAGEADIATGPARAADIDAALPNSRFVTIPGAGHMAPLEKPGPVTDAIAGFLAEVDAA